MLSATATPTAGDATDNQETVANTITDDSSKGHKSTQKMASNEETRTDEFTVSTAVPDAPDAPSLQSKGKEEASNEDDGDENQEVEAEGPVGDGNGEEGGGEEEAEEGDENNTNANAAAAAAAAAAGANTFADFYQNPYGISTALPPDSPNNVWAQYSRNPYAGMPMVPGKHFPAHFAAMGMVPPRWGSPLGGPWAHPYFYPPAAQQHFQQQQQAAAAAYAQSAAAAAGRLAAGRDGTADSAAVAAAAAAAVAAQYGAEAWHGASGEGSVNGGNSSGNDSPGHYGGGNDDMAGSSSSTPGSSSRTRHRSSLDDGDDAHRRKARKTRPNFSKDVINLLQTWILQHYDNPYPQKEVKLRMQEQTGLSELQLDNWFSNARRRLLVKDEVTKRYSIANRQPKKRGPKIV